MQYFPLYGTERAIRLVPSPTDYRVQRPFYPYKVELQKQYGRLWKYQNSLFQLGIESWYLGQ